MPFKPVENPKCPKCGKSVYAAEERVAGGLKWHKMCFKCGMCSKLLDSTNCTEHEGELFCKNCHARKYGPKGYGFGGGAGCLSMDTGAQFTEGGQTNGHRTNGACLEPRKIIRAKDGEGCPRCGGCVYAAEMMLARGKGWHKECFKCADCSKRLDSVNCCEGPDKDIYCKVCYAKKFGPKGYGYGQGGGALQSDCYANMDQAPKTTVIDTAKIQAPPGQGCPRCGGVVYAAEQVLAKGREWHRKCFKCRDCTKTLDSIIACDGPDRDVYCKTCYGKKWGPHGYGFACGSGFLQTDGLTEEEISMGRPFYNPNTTSLMAPEGQGCPRCGGMVFAAEQQLAKGTMWHKKCFNCAECHRPLDSMLACDGPDKEIHCKPCYGKLFGPKGFGYGHTPTLVSTNGESTISFPDGRPYGGQKGVKGGCPRCGYAVYAAEQMNSKNGIWHRRCFSCVDCKRSLDSTNLNDGPDGEIYCRGCYGRNYGPKGVGYGIGAGTLTMA
ncbi:muscle LIM protein Mlp84B-like isoform X1 [Ctenocephalides felis]|uniref:muscle LIM protein Mlp84B-like isoform X1 n=2 Tax=Ctenocephalides felis TaxID=7515 RepID=UPI000E6E493C|nr:muscle LIM protein Mlp84B-like isoform X1 [Ctenocephalides felis]XP_026472783.1 muscle LIM protein Mlp84B-like isoform X1 [Ctenocephalides felis]XP_026474452.1 muscle LIM protein Mlp84B-like isoform X1 [Ctenocephalides felis]